MPQGRLPFGAPGVLLPHSLLFPRLPPDSTSCLLENSRADPRLIPTHLLPPRTSLEAEPGFASDHATVSDPCRLGKQERGLFRAP